jgi:Rrf2 family protein
VRISAKGEYAIKAVLDLALHDTGGLQPIQEIAARRGIPQRYLEQVLLQLKRVGMLMSKRGSSGGYRLARPPDEITVGDVLRAVEGNDDFERGGRRRRGPGDPRDDDLAELWTDIAHALSDVVDGVSFGDLKRRAEDRRGAARAMYHI